MSKVLCLAAVLAVSCGAVLAADWPQFQGPDRNGISPETGLAKTWLATGPKELWSVKLGAGFAGPVVAGGKVYILDRVDDAKDVLRVYNLADGKEDWTFEYDAPGKLDHNGSRTSVAVDDKMVYTVGPFGQMHAIDKGTHQVVWKLDLLKDFDGKLPNWGVAQSPLVYKDWVILAPQTAKAGLIALNKADGKEVWRSKFIGAMAYASPLLTTVDGVEQVVMLTKNQVAGVDVKDGKVLWSFAEWQCQIPIPSPTPLGDGKFFVTGGYSANSALFKVAKDGEKWTATMVKKVEGCGCHISNPLLWKGFIYANSSANTNKEGLECLSLDGEVKWKAGNNPGFDWGGNLIIADGLIYIMDGNSGTLRLVDPNPDSYKQLAQAKVLAGKMVWAPMALSDGKLLCRDQGQMKCLEVK